MTEAGAGITVREPRESDWPTIGALADVSVTHMPGVPRQAEWTQRRIQFRGRRWHFVAESGGRVVGYGTLECSSSNPDNGPRLFLTLSWTDKDHAAVAGVLLARLRQIIRETGISHVWMREYAADDPFIDFMLARGFEVDGEYVHAGETLINLSSRAPGKDHRIDRSLSLNTETQESLGLLADDVFAIEALGLEWRRKDVHFVLYEGDAALSHVGLIEDVEVFVESSPLRVAGIGGVFTRPARRRQGLAPRVLGYALRRLARQSSADFAMLFCLEALVPFYQKLGWKPVGPEVSIRQTVGNIRSPLNAMIFPLRATDWPQGSAVVRERIW